MLQLLLLSALAGLLLGISAHLTYLMMRAQYEAEA